MDNLIKTTQNVVTMSDYQQHSGYAPLAIVEAYWDALRAGREMPKRAEIDPRGIESALPYSFILERVAPGVARMRIAGSHLHDIMGMEARGMPLTSFFEQDARTRVAGLLEEVFQTPGTAEVMMYSTAGLGKPALDARMVLLPLKSDLGDVSRILGCIVCPGDLGAVPRRFDLRDINFSSLGRAHQKPQAVQSEMAADGFAEEQRGFTGESGAHPKNRPPYLRLVVSDE
ncbi:PAS domain-containing protein [Sulfitobacter sp. S223]|uniref:PAS domain-containing protein n=1 Tax=Sulfitobacter sp. S223 TaxID=2867023 RepID=UPI0021A2A406|nr:PAS domain-containing protein [Sulfitobacter sp. S223]UWR24671.1 PAS domain-containing protein [Sulfitobacter sp. S223]